MDNVFSADVGGMPLWKWIQLVDERLRSLERAISALERDNEKLMRRIVQLEANQPAVNAIGQNSGRTVLG